MCDVDQAEIVEKSTAEPSDGGVPGNDRSSSQDECRHGAIGANMIPYYGELLDSNQEMNVLLSHTTHGNEEELES